MPPFRLFLASAFLLWLAFPPYNVALMAWLALVPYFLVANQASTPRRLYLSAWGGGCLFWLLAINWVQVAEPGWESWLAVGLMAAVLGAWWPGTLYLIRLAAHGLRVPFLVAAPTAWLAFEYLRAYFLSGFPWYYLAHSQYQALPVIQVSDFAGAWGPSFLIALVNALVALVVQRGLRRERPPWLGIATTAGLMVATLAYGLWKINTATFRDGPRIALLQSNLKQERQRNDPEFTLSTYLRLVRQAVRDGPKPDLIVWSETSYPFGYIAVGPDLGDNELGLQVRQIDPNLTVDFWRQRQADVLRSLHPWVDELGVPMIVGTTYYDHQVSGLSKYNAAILFQPGRREVQAYYKLHLVPFGEYVPLVKTFPPIRILTPYRDDHIPSLDSGKRPRWLDWDGLRLAVAICFEDTLPHVVRSVIGQVPDGRTPDVLVNQTNDGWFYGSSEHEAHLAISVFRSIEHRVPLLRAANTGISAVVDGNGRVLAQIQPTKEGVLTHSVPLDDRTALYTRVGDWLPILASVLSLVVFPLSFVLSRRTSSPNHPGLPNAE